MAAVARYGTRGRPNSAPWSTGVTTTAWRNVR
jgi:hypothetical protein